MSESVSVLPEGFRMDNGEVGMNRVERMPTGFRFPALHIANTDPSNPRVWVQVRYIVGDDGKVYLGCEVTGLMDDEKNDTLIALKNTFLSAGFAELGSASMAGWFCTDSSSIGANVVTLNTLTFDPEKPIAQIASVLERAGIITHHPLAFITSNGEDIRFSLAVSYASADKKVA